MLYPGRNRFERRTIHRGRNTRYACEGCPKKAMIFSAEGGSGARYKTSAGTFRVDATSYFFLNAGDPYEMEIESEQPVESFLIKLDDQWIREADRSQTESLTALLDDPGQEGREREFFVKLYNSEDDVAGLFHGIKRAVRNRAFEDEWLEESVRGLIDRVLVRQSGIRTSIASISGTKRSTREELFRRLDRARDFLEAHLAEEIHLERIAREAALSPHHFLRAFKQAFHETPHAYLTRGRVERAKQLLVLSDSPVTQICLDVGFQSAASFSNLFLKHTGVSPRAFRQQAA